MMKKETWNEFWEKYEEPSRAEKWLISERNKIIINSLKKNNYKLFKEKNLKILEVGCGFASNSRLLAKKGYKVSCIDKSPIVIEKIKKELKNSFICDARKMPFKDNCFDLVFSAGLLEHFKNPEKIIKEMFRVTKKNGIVINFVPGKYSIWQIYKILHGKNWKHGYEESYTQKKLKEKTGKSGVKFSILNSGGIDPLSICGFFLKIFGISIPFKKSIGKSSYTEIYQVYKKI